MLQSNHEGNSDNVSNAIENWHAKSYGIHAENKVFSWLERKFQKEICCLIHSFQSGNLLKILDQPGGNRVFDHFLLLEVRTKKYTMFNIYITF